MGGMRMAAADDGRAGSLPPPQVRPMDRAWLQHAAMRPGSPAGLVRPSSPIGSEVGADGRGPKPVLIVLHQENSTPGRIGRLLGERGHRLDVRRPRFGDPLPPTLADHAGAVIFGGPMSANDPDDFVRREIDWIGVALKERKPLLGLCLGAQMMARHLGARVYVHDGGRAEIGYYPVVPTADGLALSDAIGAPWPGHVYHWHREGFDCPPCSRTLATGDDFPTQAMRIGPAAFGLQFHPEVTHAMICRWTVRGHERLAAPGAQDRSRQIEGRFMHDGAVRRWLDRFLDHWLASGGVAAPVRRHAEA